MNEAIPAWQLAIDELLLQCQPDQFVFLVRDPDGIRFALRKLDSLTPEHKAEYAAHPPAPAERLVLVVDPDGRPLETHLIAPRGAIS